MTASQLSLILLLIGLKLLKRGACAQYLHWKSTSKLTQDPITENTYEYVLIRRFQSDSIKRQISRYRQLGWGWFLVSSREVCKFEKCFNRIISKWHYWKQFSRYRQMSGGRFLVNLREVNAFEKYFHRKISKWPYRKTV